MTLDELQQEWNSIKVGPRKSHDEIHRMMYSSPAWRLRKLTEKEFIGLSFVGLFVFILVVDGVGNWKIEVSLIWACLELLSQYFGVCYLRLLPQSDTLKKTLVDGLARVKRLALVSRIISVMTWIVLALILGMSAHIGMMDIILWTLMVLPLVGAVNWWNARTWAKKMEEVRKMLKEFDDEPVPTL